MLSDIKQLLAFYKHSRKDWKTKDKIIVIESDDWGSIRIPSLESYLNLQKEGFLVEKCSFLRYDNLETKEDFNQLKLMFDRIYSLTGKKPIITANYIMANPDFLKIEESNYQEYYRKYVWDHLNESDLLNGYVNSLKELTESNYFYPQLHGLEHLNVPYWMEFLQGNSFETLHAFKQNVYGIPSNITSEKRDTFLASFDYKEDKEFQNYTKPAIEEAFIKFEEFFGYKSISFISPNYTWSNNVEKVLNNNGVKYIQSSRSQILPKKYNSGKVIKNLGEKNELNQIYLVRNCVFEPSDSINREEHSNNCFKQIEKAFLFNTPAIISSHRLNFMGGLNEENRTKNLDLLEKLLLKIIKRWPDVKFLNSVELGNLILNNKK